MPRTLPLAALVAFALGGCSAVVFEEVLEAAEAVRDAQKTSDAAEAARDAERARDDRALARTGRALEEALEEALEPRAVEALRGNYETAKADAAAKSARAADAFRALVFDGGDRAELRYRRAHETKNEAFKARDEALRKLRDACNAVTNFEFAAGICRTREEAALLTAAQQEDDRAVAEALKAGNYEALRDAYEAAEDALSAAGAASDEAFEALHEARAAAPRDDANPHTIAAQVAALAAAKAAAEARTAVYDAEAAARTACRNVGGVFVPRWTPRGIVEASRCKAPTRYDP